MLGSGSVIGIILDGSTIFCPIYYSYGKLLTNLRFVFLNIMDGFSFFFVLITSRFEISFWKFRKTGELLSKLSTWTVWCIITCGMTRIVDNKLRQNRMRTNNNYAIRSILLPPASKVIFSEACVNNSVHRGACVVARGGGGWWCVHGCTGGCAWFYSVGGMHGFIWGVCGFIWGHAWFYSGGMRGFIWGACVVLFGGGCAWFYLGGHSCFFSFFGYNEIQSMSGRYASYWNAFLCYYDFTTSLSVHIMRSAVLPPPHTLSLPLSSFSPPN